MSRLSFARNFERALGQMAAKAGSQIKLPDGDLSWEQLADRIFSSSANAFAATFRRHVGLPPRPVAATAEHSQTPTRITVRIISTKREISFCLSEPLCQATPILQFASFTRSW